MERRFDTSQNFTDIFGGVQPSRQAVDLARRAIFLGEDPTALTREAGKAAQKDGRSKVGFFGKAGDHLNTLKAVVTSIEDGKAMAESRRRISKRSY